ncbi:YveK family protein [Gottfriedia acidiceleris]|uniref:Wzz/FepE/Etk N-terminal domain-containing protein n=1 Tax=Gottfriedia acidiceleris TaxID=371036 RepID=A0ABY4JR24_9BACI|nr:Wzz/FepE/Etk N-terminal domain-containing protein [Gottfriedia acidiceleris]UPM54740.1 Wzz/FepE/Etk N-terminal domain-containing protein [Gottfriedia acidiceleris]
MEETISLQELFGVIKKRLIMIISITVVATVVTGVISYLFLTPIYQSSTQLLVNQKETKDSSIYQNNQVQTNVQLINTYNVVIKSPAILDEVIKQLNLDYTVAELTKNITVASEANSQVFTVSVQDPDPKQAQTIVNTIANVFQAKIKTIMSVDNVTILAKADLSENPIKPNKKLNIAIGFVVGLMLSVGIAFLLEFLDNTVKTEKQLEELLELPILGVISEVTKGKITPKIKLKLGKGA